jgi:tripartite-type tricarboxylate transporter receptor subunit TctC
MRAGAVWAFAAALSASAIASPAQADAVADFYKGKTVSILLGTGPGATYDFYARILAKHMSRHIPGEPAITVNYMPGAAGLNMFNHLYNAAPRDGTVFANTFGTLPVNQLFKPDAVRYDAQKFNWLGSVSRDVSVLAVNATAPVKTLEDAKKNEMVIGSIGLGNGTYYFPALINAVLGTKIKIITGYPSGNDIYKAMEADEVHGYAPVWLSLVSVKPDWLRDNKVALVAQSGTVKHKDKELADVPLLYDLVQKEDDRQMVRFFSASAPIDRASAAPPGVPADRLAALEQALSATVKDPAYLAEMAERKLTVDPSSKDEVVAAVRQIIETPPALVARIKAAFGE